MCWPRSASSTNMRWPTARSTRRCWRRCRRSATTGTCRPSCGRRVRGCGIGLGPGTSNAPAGPAGRCRCDNRRRRRCYGPRRAGGTGSCWCCCGLAACGLVRCSGYAGPILHLVPNSAALGCPVPGPHVHVVGRDNPNRARAKSGDRTVPVRAEVLSCYDRYLTERAAVPAAESCDFVLVTLRHQPVGRPMSTDTVRKWLAALSVRAGLDRAVTPHMFRHSTATELLARGAASTSSRNCSGTLRSVRRRPTCIPTSTRCGRRWTDSGPSTCEGPDEAAPPGGYRCHETPSGGTAFQGHRLPAADQLGLRPGDRDLRPGPGSSAAGLAGLPRRRVRA